MIDSSLVREITKFEFNLENIKIGSCWRIIKGGGVELNGLLIDATPDKLTFITSVYNDYADNPNFNHNLEYRYYEFYADMFRKDDELSLLQLYPIATRFVTDLTTNITSVYEDPINGMKIKNCDNTSGTYLGEFGIPVPGSENAK